MSMTQSYFAISRHVDAPRERILQAWMDTAIAFTEVPVRMRHFVRQRQRWARGMIEGLRDHGGTLLRQRKLLAHSIAVNYLFPFLDGMYSLAFLPGIVLACAGNFMIA